MRICLSASIILSCALLAYVLSYAPVVRLTYGPGNSPRINRMSYVHQGLATFYAPVESALERGHIANLHQPWARFWKIELHCDFLRYRQQFREMQAIQREGLRHSGLRVRLDHLPVTTTTTPPSPTSDASPLPLQECAAAGE